MLYKDGDSFDNSKCDLSVACVANFDLHSSGPHTIRSIPWNCSKDKLKHSLLTAWILNNEAMHKNKDETMKIKKEYDEI